MMTATSRTNSPASADPASAFEGNDAKITTTQQTVPGTHQHVYDAYSQTT